MEPAVPSPTSPVGEPAAGEPAAGTDAASTAAAEGTGLTDRPSRDARPLQPTRRLGAPTPRAALTAAAAGIVIAILLLAFSSIRPFVLGVVLVYLLAPLVDRLSRAGVPRALAVLISFAITIAVIVVLAMVSLTPLIQQMTGFIADLPNILERARPVVEDFYASLNLSPEVRAYLDDLIASAAAGAGDIDLGGIVAPILGSVFGVIGAITAYAILPAWLFFLLKDRTKLADRLETALPGEWRGDVFAVFAMIDRVFGNWIRGQLLLGAVVGLASFVGLEILSVVVHPVFGQYALLLALVAGVLELVPFIGPIIAAVPAVLIGLTAGPGGFFAALILYLLIQQLENNILVPKIQGDAVELHPSAVMLALVVGAALAGILGAIISLPIAAAGRDVFKYLFRRVSEPPATVREALTAVSPTLLRSVRPSALADDPA
jgi:predicted PurR-regulated permease PerM